MSSRILLIISVSIFVTTAVVVAVFGVVPIPDYEDLTSDNKLSGKLIYHIEIQTENILPPAPDIMDSCIFYIDLSDRSLMENPIVCSSDLYELSYDIYFIDAQIYEEENIVLYYWDYETVDERKALIIDITSGKIVEQIDGIINSNENDNMNVYGEKLIDPWESSDYNSRSIGIYYVTRTETLEVFNSRAPSNYYFESLHWSPDGNYIVAGDSENNLIIFSKNKAFTPLKIHLKTDVLDDENIELINVLGWTN
tara:strand:+ start:45 stop:803 length:759 start_codon:yes stop_codon:yes gene_type:complete